MEEVKNYQMEQVDQWTLLKEFWSHFSENKGAVFGLALILTFILIAILLGLVSQDLSTLLASSTAQSLTNLGSSALWKTTLLKSILKKFAKLLLLKQFKK